MALAGSPNLASAGTSERVDTTSQILMAANRIERIHCDVAWGRSITAYVLLPDGSVHRFQPADRWRYCGSYELFSTFERTKDDARHHYAGAYRVRSVDRSASDRLFEIARGRPPAENLILGRCVDGGVTTYVFGTKLPSGGSRARVIRQSECTPGPLAEPWLEFLTIATGVFEGIPE
jgi:hypothetical protein